MSQSGELEKNLPSPAGLGRIYPRVAMVAEGGFGAIVREHQGVVVSIAYHFLRDRPVAEELAQVVFLHLHKNMRAIEAPSHLVYSLRTVATHRHIDDAR